ncbi:MAG: cation diffusion facilitator family transporter [Chthoniobacteraceae bacterium]
MAHDHGHSTSGEGGHSHGHSHGGEGGNLALPFFLNLGFAILEVVGGLWTNSLAILTDALHDAGDTASIGVAWFLQRVARRRSDATFTYGYRRFSVLGALITGLVLLAGLVFIIGKAVPRLFAPEPVQAPGMIVLAIIGIAVNGAAVLRLRGSSKLEEKVVSWHLLEDVLGWVAVLAGSIAMALWGLPILDPLLSIAISLFVLWNVIRSMKRVFLVFLQSAPASFDAAKFSEEVATLPGVQSIHHTHSWSIDGERHVFSTHLVLPRSASAEDASTAKLRVRELLEPHDFEHITIETELEGDACQSEREKIP